MAEHTKICVAKWIFAVKFCIFGRKRRIWATLLLKFFQNPQNSATFECMILRHFASFTAMYGKYKIKEPLIYDYHYNYDLLDQNIEAEKLQYKKIHKAQFCPTFEELNHPPKNCHNRPKKFPRVYNSDFYPIHTVYSPGPSEQANSIKHIFMLAAMMNKGIVIGNFTIHKSDRKSRDDKTLTVYFFGCKILQIESNFLIWEPFYPNMPKKVKWLHF